MKRFCSVYFACAEESGVIQLMIWGNADRDDALWTAIPFQSDFAIWFSRHFGNGKPPGQRSHKALSGLISFRQDWQRLVAVPIWLVALLIKIRQFFDAFTSSSGNRKGFLRRLAYRRQQSIDIPGLLTYCGA